MSSKSGAAGEIVFFESEKRHEIRPLKSDTLTVSTFDAFIHVHDKSKHGTVVLRSLTACCSGSAICTRGCVLLLG